MSLKSQKFLQAIQQRQFQRVPSSDKKVGPVA